MLGWGGCVCGGGAAHCVILASHTQTYGHNSVAVYDVVMWRPLVVVEIIENFIRFPHDFSPILTE